LEQKVRLLAAVDMPNRTALLLVLNKQEQAILFEALSDEDKARILREMDTATRNRAMKHMGAEEKARLKELMYGKGGRSRSGSVVSGSWGKNRRKGIQDDSDRGSVVSGSEDIDYERVDFGEGESGNVDTTMCPKIQAENIKLKREYGNMQEVLDELNRRLLEGMGEDQDPEVLELRGKLEKVKRKKAEKDTKMKVAFGDDHADQKKKKFRMEEFDDPDENKPEDEVWIKHIGKPCPMPSMHQSMRVAWEWETPDGQWIAYGADISKIMEDAHEDQQKYISMCIRGVPVQVFIQGRTQVNLITNESANLQRAKPHITFETVGPDDVSKGDGLNPEQKKIQDKLMKSGKYTAKEYKQLKDAGMLTKVQEKCELEEPPPPTLGEDEVARFWGAGGGSAGEQEVYKLEMEMKALKKEIEDTNGDLEDLYAELKDDKVVLEDLFAKLME